MIATNLRRWQRVLRWLLGTLLLAWAFSGGPAWTLVGFYFAATGSWGYCPIVVLWRRRQVHWP